jgi:CheY-like chemotaxis protein
MAIATELELFERHNVAVEPVFYEEGSTAIADFAANKLDGAMFVTSDILILASQIPLFELFFTTKEPGKRSGLGLPQVHGIVGQHQGRIDVHSQLGRGTTFNIYMPALPVTTTDSSVLVLSEELSALPTGQGQTILVVEDRDATRQALAESLELLNYRVLKAADGQEALEVLEKHGAEIALLLSDVVMSKMGSETLLYAVQERGLQAKAVLITGHPLEELEDLRVQGVIDWLPKPPSLKKLAEVIARSLNVD